MKRFSLLVVFFFILSFEPLLSQENKNVLRVGAGFNLVGKDGGGLSVGTSLKAEYQYCFNKFLAAEAQMFTDYNNKELEPTTVNYLGGGINAIYTPFPKKFRWI